MRERINRLNDAQEITSTNNINHYDPIGRRTHFSWPFARSLASLTASSNKLFFILFARLDVFSCPDDWLVLLCLLSTLYASHRPFFFLFSFKSKVVIYLSFSFLYFFPLRSHFQFNFFSLSSFHNSFYVYLI